MRSASISREARGRWRSGCAMLLAALALVPAARRSDAQAVTGTTFRAESELVVLQVAVVDHEERFISDLQLEDFSVYDEGQRQNVALFASTSAPLDLMLLLDTSASMEGRIGLVREAAINFLRTLKKGDQAAVVLFNTRVESAGALTGDVEALEGAVGKATPRGATALYEALYIALRELDRARRGSSELRRRAIVVLSDGDDNSSRIPFEDVLEAARRLAVTIYTITVSSPAVDLALRSYVERSAGTRFHHMRRLAEESGGRSFAPLRIEDLSGVYQEVAHELGEQYWLAYAPPAAAKSGFRRISVRVDTRPGLRTRTRSGYYARPPQRGASGAPAPKSVP